MPGAKVSFECNEGFVLIGDQRRECLSTGLWNIPEYGYTTCLRKLIYTCILFAIYIFQTKLLIKSVLYRLEEESQIELLPSTKKFSVYKILKN